VTYASDAEAIERARALVRGVLAKRQPDRVFELLGESERRLATAIEYLLDRAESRGSPGAAGRWYILPEALAQWQDLTGAPTVERARESLIDVCRAAGLRETDAEGRQLYRAPKRMGRGARLVVDPHAGEREGDLPTLLWVGLSRPPRWCWTPVEEP